MEEQECGWEWTEPELVSLEIAPVEGDFGCTIHNNWGQSILERDWSNMINNRMNQEG